MLCFSLRAAASRPRAVPVYVFAAALFAGGVAHAGIVTDCGDAQDATTTLRGVVASASDNDVIDVSQCSAIVLLHGAISTLLNLTIQGPLDGTASIDAGANDRAFVDTGYSDTGYSVLKLNHLLIEHGRAPEADPNGGCVYAYRLDVQNSTLNDCAATSNSLDARGGAVFAAILTLTSSAVTNSSVTSSSGLAGGGAVFAGFLTLTSSVVTNSSATSASGDAIGGAVFGSDVTLDASVLADNSAMSVTGGAGGGAVAASTKITCSDSLVRSNEAVSGGGQISTGGGISGGTLSLTRCSVVGNQVVGSSSSGGGGGIFGGAVNMDNSTVSGNSTDGVGGGIIVTSTIAVSNSTIAFNQARTCGGLFAPGGNTINATIIANNAATTETPIPCQDVFASFGTGTNNIVGVVDNNSPPGDTYIGDPHLTPLGNHGGSTPTHALSSNSYAIDHGNNANAFDTDQRGSGYAREVNGVADIGAYERQAVDDEIFYSGTE